MSMRACSVVAFAAVVFGGTACGSDESVTSSTDAVSGTPSCTRPLDASERAAVSAEMRGAAVRRAFASPRVIDVWFHIASASDRGGVPDDMVAKQIRVLNETYAGTGFTFRLVGTDRTQNDDWYYARKGSADEAEMESTLHRGDARTLNIYAIWGDVLDGWAHWPWDASRRPSEDGVVIAQDVLPGFDDDQPHNLGRTTSHEVGHWLGLYHTFEGGCDGGDEVDDTAPEASAADGCPEHRDTCGGGGSDPVHNFMDYSADICRTQFTRGQIDRMRDAWSNYRQ